MKKYLLLIVFQWMIVETFGQAGVGIGVEAPDASAALHVQPPSNNKGMLIPRLTTDQRNSINPAAEGLLVYDTDVNALYHFNVTWQQVGLPQGSIIMWSGTTVPEGWALCDGSVTGRPDLRDKFIMGSGGTYTTGTPGGAATVTLNEEQMPRHDHPVFDPGHNHKSGNFDRLLRNQQQTESGKTVATIDNSLNEPVVTESGIIANASTGISVGFRGGDPVTQLPDPVEILPPFYALAFIIKL